MNAKFGDVFRGGLVSGVLAVAALAGCSGPSQSTSPGPPVPSSPPRDSQIYVTTAGKNATPSEWPNTVMVFSISSLLAGTFAPKQQFQSPSFSDALGVAVDSAGSIYVTDDPTGVVDVFSGNADGVVSPTRQISSSAMRVPVAIALDGSNNIYVADPFGGPGAIGQIDVFSSFQSGKVTPVRTISGTKTRLNQPYGIAVNANGTMFVTNDAGNSVVQFAAGTTGNVAPTRVIKGAGSMLDGPMGISIGPGGAVYVANSGNATVTVYGATGNVPVREIGGGNTKLTIPMGTATDGDGNLFVANGFVVKAPSNPGAFLAFGPSATGDATPFLTATDVGQWTWAIARF